MRTTPYKAACLSCAVIALAGCYTYRPVDVQNIIPPQDVRLSISPEGVERITAVTGSGVWLTPGERVLGDLVYNQDKVLLLEVPSAETDLGAHGSTAFSQRLRLGVDDVIAAEIRELDGAKTGVLIGAAAVVLGIVVVGAVTGWTGAGGGKDQVDPPEAVVPVRR